MINTDNLLLPSPFMERIDKSFILKDMHAKTTTLFKHNYEAAGHVIINQGGTSSGKTYAIEQVLFCLAAANEKQVITVVGQDIPNLKSGAMRDAEAIHRESEILKLLIKNYNHTDRIFHFKNGSGTMG